MREGIVKVLRGAGIVAIAAAATIVAPAAAQQAAAGQMKLAVIDARRLVTDSVAGKAALAKLQKIRDDKLAEAKSKQDEIDGLRKRLNEGRMSLSDDKIADLEKQLEDKGTEFRRFQEDAQKDLDKAQEQTFADIEKKVSPIIEQVGHEGGYTMIFNKYQSGLVYADDSTDITDQVIQRFDAASSQTAKPN
jgi:outer membrane protein